MKEHITFDLMDGYEDESGGVHKRVVMRQLTMQDQITIKDLDQNAQKLLSSKYDLDSKNQVERQFALAEFNQYYCIVFGQTVLSIGDIPQDQLRAKAIFHKLTSRDIGIMIAYQNGAGGRLIKVDRVLAILDSIKIADGLRNEIRSQLKQELGEAPAAAEN